MINIDCLRVLSLIFNIHSVFLNVTEVFWAYSVKSRFSSYWLCRTEVCDITWGDANVIIFIVTIHLISLSSSSNSSFLVIILIFVFVWLAHRFSLLDVKLLLHLPNVVVHLMLPLEDLVKELSILIFFEFQVLRDIRRLTLLLEVVRIEL